MYKCILGSYVQKLHNLDHHLHLNVPEYKTFIHNMDDVNDIYISYICLSPIPVIVSHTYYLIIVYDFSLFLSQSLAFMLLFSHGSLLSSQSLTYYML